MNDTQRRAVLDSMSAARSGWVSEVDVDRACAVLGVDRSQIRERAQGMCVSPTRIEIAPYAHPLTVLHAVAHAATPSVFPTHGSEFCENLLKAAEETAPHHAYVLRHEFDARGVHYTPRHRRRAVIKAVIQRSVDGTHRVEAVFDDPPERVVGRMSYDPQRRVVCGKPLDRLRYLAKID